jgi:hypothetical protein
VCLTGHLHWYGSDLSTAGWGSLGILQQFQWQPGELKWLFLSNRSWPDIYFSSFYQTHNNLRGSPPIRLQGVKYCIFNEKSTANILCDIMCNHITFYQKTQWCYLIAWFSDNMMFWSQSRIALRLRLQLRNTDKITGSPIVQYKAIRQYGISFFILKT